jgi:hypothetical protein
MKTTRVLIAILIWVMMGSCWVMAQKKSRSQRNTEAFARLTQLIDSKQYRFEADFAYPSSYPVVNLSTNPNSLDVKDSIGEVWLPFFGRAYSVPYGDSEGGIHCKGFMQNYNVKINERRYKYQIQFEIIGKSDVYRFFLEAYAGGGASLNVICKDRSPITYQGKLKEIPPLKE